MRDSAVHFTGVSHAPVWHEGLQTNIARENVDFSTESAERAVAFLMQVLAATFVTQGTGTRRVAAWGAARAHVLAELEALVWS